MAGDVVDATSWPGDEQRAWITAQLKLKDRWIEAIKQRPRAGIYHLTPAMAKALGIPYDVLLQDTDPRKRAWSERQRELARVA